MPIVIPNLERACDVCRLVDADTTVKNCGYCSLCDAWICEHCVADWPRRIKAAVKRQLEPDYKGIPDYVELARKGPISSQS